MLCPETWRFAPPKSNYKEQKRNFLDDGNEKTTPSVLFDFNYAHLVSIVLPNIEHQPAPEIELKELLSVDCDYYKVEDLSLDEFISSEFIEKFIKSGELSALSINTKLDLDNCVCVTPGGVLVLNLDKETYQGLGLEGTVSHFANQRKNKYIVEIKLKNVRGKAQIERMRKSLSERLNKFTLILSWHPPEPNICPSSIAKYLSNRGYNIYLCQPKHQIKNTQKVRVPILFPDSNADDNEHGSDLIEWLGMFCLDADLTTGKYDNYVNTYECPEENVICGNVAHFKWRGFYTRQKIKELYDYLIEYVQTLSKNKVPWISLYVQGFSDAPVSWNLTENHFFTNSENAYGFFLKPDGNYLLCTQMCSNKRQK